MAAIYIKSRLSALILALVLAPPFGHAQTVATQPHASGIDESLSTFLKAFDNLDWPAFRACFSPDATMFHPASPNIKRIDTPEQFEKAWLGVFARIKTSSGRTAPPYMNLQPEDLQIQMLSPEIALVTFHLFDGPTTSRRTLILKQLPGGWKIVHLHASNITASADH